MDAKYVNAVAYAHGEYTSWGNLKKFVALYWGDRIPVTQEQKDAAKLELDKLRAERIAKIWNTLTFVGMGMEHNINDIGNHRIRTYIQRKDGRKFFVELWCTNDIRVDFVVDVDQQNAYDAALTELSKTPRGERTPAQKIEWEHYQKQPYYQYRKYEAWLFAHNTAATKGTVLDFVNYVFETNFTDIEIENTLLTTDDYISKE